MIAVCFACTFGLALGIASSQPVDERLAHSLEQLFPSSTGEFATTLPMRPEECSIIISARENTPRLVLNTGGPVSAVRTLEFSPDSQRLYSAGNDKAIQVWGIQTSSRAIRRTALNRAVLVQTLRWDIARGLRGVVYTLAASPVSREVAMAGYSSWTRPWGDAGDIVVYDSANAQVVRVLEGHAQTVISLSYSPNGQKIASISSDGEVRLWSAPDWQPVVLRNRLPHPPLFPQPLEFISDSTLAVATSTNQQCTQWQVELFDTSAQPARSVKLPQIHQVRLTSLVRGPSGRWASADIAGHIYLWQGDRQPPPVLLRKDRAASDMCFTPEGNLFVATLLQNNQAVLEYWNTTSKQLIDQVQTGTTAHNLACAVSPDGSRVATCASDDNQVWVFMLKDREGNPVPQPLSRGNLLRLKGRGNKVWKVAFAEDGSYRIGIGFKAKRPAAFNDYGDISASFDLVNRTFQDQLGENWRSPDDGASGWTVTRDRTGQVLTLRSPAGVTATVTLDNESQGQAQAYCWIAGDGKPFGLAVGTNKQQGVFVYGIPRTGGDCPLLRYYRDHNDAITSLSVSADGKYLASSSQDQTVKIWSLEGIRATGDDFAAEPAWGGVFRLVDGKVQLTSAIEDGAATRKGIRVGDTIVEAKFDRRVAKRLGQPGDTEYTTRQPREILDGLLLTPPTSDLLLTIERGGKQLNRQVLLKPAWEPLLTLFVDENGEWALWSPQGYYDASIGGDELFGWQMNRGIHNTPDFYRADQFRGSLERPEVIGQLLHTGNVREAIRQSGVTLTTTADRVLIENVQSAPVVSIVAPSDGQLLAEQQIPVEARVRYPSVEVADAANVRAFVNGVPGETPTVTGNGVERTYAWRVPSADYYNRVRVSVEGMAPERLSQFSDVHFRAEATRKTKPKLHILALAANEYKGGMLPALGYPVIDAESIVQRLTTSSEELYDRGVVRTLLNDQISPVSVQDAINSLSQELSEARPDDLLVVFMAGHGFAFDDEYYFIPPHPRFAAVEAAGDELEENLKSLAIAWKQLRQLSNLRCRKVFMLDTCYAGNILLTHDRAEHLKEAIRPLKADEIVVISATDANQEAVEAEALGHGVFTKCLLDGFAGGADKSKDKEIDLREISDYVVTEVPKITKQYQAQTPRVSPLDLVDLISVPIVKYE